MVSETIFRVIVPVLVITFALHRGYYVKNHSKPEEATLKKRAEGLPSKIAGLLGLIGFISILVFTINPDWLSFANLDLPGEARRGESMRRGDVWHRRVTARAVWGVGASALVFAKSPGAIW